MLEVNLTKNEGYKRKVENLNVHNIMISYLNIDSPSNKIMHLKLSCGKLRIFDEVLFEKRCQIKFYKIQ